MSLKYARNFLRSIVFVLVTSLVINLEISPIIAPNLWTTLLNLLGFAVMILMLELVIEEGVNYTVKGRKTVYQIGIYLAAIVGIALFLIYKPPG